MRLFGRIRKREFLCLGLQKKIKRIMNRHFGDEIHFDAKLGGLFGEDHAGQIIGLRVLLPVNEMLTRHNPH